RCVLSVYGLLKVTKRRWPKTRQDPAQVRLVANAPSLGCEFFPWRWGEAWQQPAGPFLCHQDFPGGSALGGDECPNALAVLRDKRIEIYDICNPLRHAVGDACNYHPAGTASDENDLMEVLKFKDTRDVLDMSLKPDLAAYQMRSLAESGERWREH